MVESLDEIVTIHCIGDTVDKIRIIVSLGDPKRVSPLAIRSFFKILNSF